jgi:proteasome lid subunit RPN8/RPN11
LVLSCICRTAIERYEENCAASVFGTSGTRERKSLRVSCAPEEYRAEIQAASES